MAKEKMKGSVNGVLGPDVTKKHPADKMIRDNMAAGKKALNSISKKTEGKDMG